MRPVHKRYLREFIPAMLAYVALILLFGYVVPRTQDRVWHVVLAVLPRRRRLAGGAGCGRDLGDALPVRDLRPGQVAGRQTLPRP